MRYSVLIFMLASISCNVSTTHDDKSLKAIKIADTSQYHPTTFQYKSSDNLSYFGLKYGNDPEYKKLQKDYVYYMRMNAQYSLAIRDASSITQIKILQKTALAYLDSAQQINLKKLNFLKRKTDTIVKHGLNK